MMERYGCTDCGYRFWLGGFHYHPFSSEGYSASSSSICSACGAQIAVEHAAPVIHERRTIPIRRVTVTAIPPSAKSAVAHCIRRQRLITLTEAFELAEHPPIVLLEGTGHLDGRYSIEDLEAAGATIEDVVLGEAPNPGYQPGAERDRVTVSLPPGHAPRSTPAERDARILEGSCPNCGAKDSLDQPVTACPACRVGRIALIEGFIT